MQLERKRNRLLKRDNFFEKLSLIIKGLTGNNFLVLLMKRKISVFYIIN